MNAKVLRGLRTKTFDSLNKCGRHWADEVPIALWSLCMTPIEQQEKPSLLPPVEQKWYSPLDSYTDLLE